MVCDSDIHSSSSHQKSPNNFTKYQRLTSACATIRYLAFTAGILALFILAEIPGGESLEERGAGEACGIVLGTAAGVLVLCYIFFVPYFHRRLVKNDARMRPWHIPLGPLLYREDPPVYFPGKGTQVVTDYYAKTSVEEKTTDLEKDFIKDNKSQPIGESTGNNGDAISTAIDDGSNRNGTSERSGHGLSVPNPNRLSAHIVPGKPEPEERWLHPVRDLPIYHPKKLSNWAKYALLQGVSRDVVTQKSKSTGISYHNDIFTNDNPDLGDVHARATVYDNRVEHLWTYAQVASAMMMSIAHGSNDGKIFLVIFSVSDPEHLLIMHNSCQRCGSLGRKLQYLCNWRGNSYGGYPHLDSGGSWSSTWSWLLVYVSSRPLPFFVQSRSDHTIQSTVIMSCARLATRSLRSAQLAVLPWSSARPLPFFLPRGSLCQSQPLNASPEQLSVLLYATLMCALSTGSK